MTKYIEEVRGKYDAFLSYNTSDSGNARIIASQLETEGLVVFFDRTDLPPGAKAWTRLAAIIESAPAFIVCCGPNGLGPIQQKEIETALLRAQREDLFRIIPLLLNGAARGTVPLALREFVWVDFGEYLRLDAPIRNLARGIRGEALREGEEFSEYAEVQAFLAEKASDWARSHSLLSLRELQRVKRAAKSYGKELIKEPSTVRVLVRRSKLKHAIRGLAVVALLFGLLSAALYSIGFFDAALFEESRRNIRWAVIENEAARERLERSLSLATDGTDSPNYSAVLAAQSHNENARKTIEVYGPRRTERYVRQLLKRAERGTPDLIENLSSSSPEARIHAAIELSKSAPERGAAIAPLLSIVRNDREPVELRAAAAHSLTWLVTYADDEALAMKVFQTFKDTWSEPAVRLHASGGLFRCRAADREAIDLLIETLALDDEPTTRGGAAISLGHMAADSSEFEPVILPALAAGIRSPLQDVSVRALSATALGLLASGTSNPRTLQSVEESLLVALGDSPEVVISAAKALATLPHISSRTKERLASLGQSANMFIRDQAERTLDQLGSGAAKTSQ